MYWIFLPAYNEEKSLPKLLPKIDNFFKSINSIYRIVIVNDGSTDNTEQIIKEYSTKYPIDVIIHKINRGLGETERDGFEFIAQNSLESDIIIRLDCDDSHEPKYIAEMIKKLNEGFDVVNTSRFLPGGGQIGVSNYRAFISYLANKFMSIMFNIKGTKDYSCGYRAYRASIIKDAIKIFGNNFIQLKGLGFTSTLEMIVKLKILGAKFAEVSFILRYDQKLSKSKMVSSVTTVGYIIMALLYHWPFGGWKRQYKNLSFIYKKDRMKAIEIYSKIKNNFINKLSI